MFQNRSVNRLETIVHCHLLRFFEKSLEVIIFFVHQVPHSFGGGDLLVFIFRIFTYTFFYFFTRYSNYTAFYIYSFKRKSYYSLDEKFCRIIRVPKNNYVISFWFC